jgi:hypothetical protein
VAASAALRRPSFAIDDSVNSSRQVGKLCRQSRRIKVETMKFIIPKNQRALGNRRTPFALIALSALCAALPVVLPQPAQAKPIMDTSEVWPGRRVVLVLPLQLSDNWNADPQWGQRLLRPSEHLLRRALEATGKFSVIQTYQFDPVLQRALQDKLIEKSQLDAMVETPTLQTASGILDKLGFPLKPLIADFRLEEVRSSGDAKAPSVQVQVLGKLYELNSEAAQQTKVFTSDPIKKRGSQFDQVLEATDNALRMVANEFVRPPAEIALPRIEPSKVAPKPTGKKPVKPVKSVKPTPVTPAVAAPVSPASPNAPITPPPTVVGPPLTAPIDPTFNTK